MKMLCIAHENADEIQNITNLEFGDQLWTKFLLFFLIWNGSNRFSRFTLCHFHVFPEKIQTINKFRRLCLWCDVALCLLNSVFTTNESRSAEMSFGFQHLTLLESATHMTPNERFSPHELQWNSRKFVVEWDEYGEMHKMMEKYHQKNNLNLCIFPISASKIFTMVKSRLKNIERGMCNCCCEFNAPMLLVSSVDSVESSLSDVKRMKCLRLSKVVKCFVFLFHTMFVQLN